MTQEQKQIQSHLQKLNEALSGGTFLQVRRMLNHLPAADIAHLIESSPPRARHILWKLVDKEQEGDILQHLGDDIRNQFLSQMDTQELLAATESFDDDDLADALQQLPDAVIQEVLRSMDAQNRQRLEIILYYPEDTAGGLMNTDVITVRPDITVDTVLRYLRRHEKIPAMTDSIFIINRLGKLIGLLPITKMLVEDINTPIDQIMTYDIEGIAADMPENEVANLFERHDLISAPVINDKGILLGRITIDDVVDVIRDEADHSLMSMAGLDEDADTFAPVIKSAKSRAVWLGINLITAFVASATIGLFEHTIDKVVALAILMPIVASMGGIAGSQTLTLVIRGMALGQVGKANANWLLSRELAVGILNGLLWAIVVAAAAIAWFQDIIIGMVIAAAMVINLIVATVMGAALPMLLRARNIDPALAGSVLLTTITDVVGFTSFLGLATIFYG